MAGEFPAQLSSNAENISIWWRHHEHLQWQQNKQCDPLSGSAPLLSVYLGHQRPTDPGLHVLISGLAARGPFLSTRTRCWAAWWPGSPSFLSFFCSGTRSLSVALWDKANETTLFAASVLNSGCTWIPFPVLTSDNVCKFVGLAASGLSLALKRDNKSHLSIHTTFSSIIKKSIHTCGDLSSEIYTVLSCWLFVCCSFPNYLFKT